MNEAETRAELIDPALHPDGTSMSAQQFMEMLFGKLPEFFQSEAELRALWSVPDTRPRVRFSESGRAGRSSLP